MTLVEWLMIAMTGPLLVAFFVAASVAMVRSRLNTQRIETLSEAVAEMAGFAAKLEVINERCTTRCQTDKESRNRNDQAHVRLENSVAETRQEFRDLVAELKKELLNEIREVNGRR